MVRWLLLCTVAVAASTTLLEARAIPAEPISLMMDVYGNPVLFLREKRAPTYPKRMMITGYYQPSRRSSGDQASGVFAQGNAVSGQTYLGGMQPPYLPPAPENEEQEISNAEAEAAPVFPEEVPVEEKEQEEAQTESPVNEEPAPAEPASPVKPKKPEADEEDEEDEDDMLVPFVPFKPGRRQSYPNLNNFFPMIFSFPGSVSRSGGEGSNPGAITAIANSYSTGKGGVAHSVATAYGAPLAGKKQRRARPANE